MKQKIKRCFAILMTVFIVSSGLLPMALASESSTEIMSERMTETVVDTEEISITEETNEAVTEFSVLETEKRVETPITEQQKETETLAEETFAEETLEETEIQETESPKETETSKGRLEISVYTNGGTVQVKDGNDQIHEVRHQADASPFTLEEKQGTVVQIEIRSDSEGYEIGTYQITMDSGGDSDQKEFSPGTTAFIQNCTIAANDTIRLGVWFRKVESETENETETKNEPETETESERESERKDYGKAVFRIMGNGSVFIKADGENVAVLTGNGAVKEITSEELKGKNITYTMAPEDRNYPFSVKKDGKMIAETCWMDMDRTASYFGSLILPVGEYEFQFLTEEELSRIPTTFDDSSLYPGGKNDHLLGNGATPGKNIHDPRAGEYYTAPATFYAPPGYSQTNSFAAQGGTVVPDYGNEIRDVFGTSFWMTTCGSTSSQLCPANGARGTLYLYIVSRTDTHAEYQAAFQNSNGLEQNVYGNYTVDIPLSGGIKVIKSLANEDKANTGVYKLDAVFGVYNASGDRVGTVKTDPDTGIGILDGLEEGTYTLKELLPPKYATKATGSKICTVKTGETATVEFRNYPYLGRIHVKKRDGDGQWHEDMKGAVYGVWLNKSCTGDPLTTTKITGPDTEIKASFAFGKTYYIKEIKAPPSGKWGLSRKTLKVSFIEEDLPSKVQEEDDRYVPKTILAEEKEISPVKIRVRKTSTLSQANLEEWMKKGNYTLANAAYTFYWDSACEKEIGTVVTHIHDDGYYTGWLEIPDLKADKEYTIYYQETRAPEGHAKNLETKEFHFTAPSVEGKKAEYEISDKDRYNYGSLYHLLRKIDQEGNLQEPLPGAVFELKWLTSAQGGSVIQSWKFRTDENGELDIDHPVEGELYVSEISGYAWFPEGDYVIQEVEAPEGYLKDSTPRPFSLVASDEPSESGVTTNQRCDIVKDWDTGIPNRPEKGAVRVRKISANPEITGGNTLYSFQGATFGIFENADGNGLPKVVLTAGADGTTEKVTLKKGTYYLKELSVPEGYQKNPEIFPVTLAVNEEKEVVIPDEPVVFPIETAVQKVVPKGTDIPTEHAEFLFRYSGGGVSRTWVLKSTADGKVKMDREHFVSGDTFFTLKGKTVLPIGILTIKETKAPEGCQLNPKTFTFHIQKDGTTGGPDGPILNEGIQIFDELLYGGVKIYKTSMDQGTVPDGNARFENAEFAIYNKNNFRVIRKDIHNRSYAPNEEVARMTTDGNGLAQIGPVLEAGTYAIREVKAPEGYQISDREILFTITKEGEIVDKTSTPIQDKVYRGGFTIQKWDSIAGKPMPQGNTSLKGAEFTVKNTSAGSVKVGGKVYKPGETVLVLTTNEAGFAETGRNVLPYGTYSVEETKAPKGYLKDTEAKTVTILKNGQYGTEGFMAETKEKGVFQDTPIRGGFIVQKRDKETNADRPQGDASLKGAEFTVKNRSVGAVVVNGKICQPGETVLVLTTNEAGFAETGERALPYGTYSIEETRAPKGYLRDETVKTVVISRDGQYKTEGYSVDSDYLEQVVRGGFVLQKWDLEQNVPEESQGDAVLQGAEFTLTNFSDHSVRIEEESYGANQVIQVFTTDETGKISVPPDYLPYGTYKIEETTPPTGYTSTGEHLSRIFEIRENGKILDFTTEETAAKNRVIRFDLSLWKFKDHLSSEEPGEHLIPLEGVEFEVRLKSTGELVTTLITDEEGYATTKDAEQYPHGRLPYGVYRVTETKHPAGVMPIESFDIFGQIDHKEYKGIYLNNRPVETPISLVKKSADQSLIIQKAGTEFQILNEQKEVMVFDVYYPHPIKVTNFVADASGTVTIPKKLPYGTYYLREVHAPEGYLKGEDLKFTVDKWGSWTDPVEISYLDQPVKGRIRITKTDASTGKRLSGAVFTIFAGEDLVTPDGFRHYSKGEVVETVSIGEDGQGTSGKLPLGKYVVKETKVPAGFCLDHREYPVILSYADENTPVVYEELQVSNQPTTLKILKTDRDGKTLDGVKFEINRIKSIPDLGFDLNGEINRKIFVTKDGGVIMETCLKSGVYSIKETETLPGYVAEKIPRFVTVDENGFIFESDKEGNPLDKDKANSHMEKLSWVNGETRWEFSKSDITGKRELAGAKMEIQTEDGTSVYSWTSDGRVHQIEKIPVGKYILVEKAAPKGYVTASKIPFEVINDENLHRVTMIDKQVIAKKRNTEGSQIEGARMKVIEAEALGVTGREPKVVDAWTTDGKDHVIEGLQVGKNYMLIEEEAPKGWVKAKPVAFSVPDDGQNQEIVMTDIRVKAVKTNVEGRSVRGAVLEVQDLEGKVLDTWETGKEPHDISHLTVGQTYRLVERKAPDGYALANPIDFTVEDHDQNQEVRIVNKQVLVSKRSLTGKKELPGARLTVKDKNGNVVDSWVSQKKPHAVSNLKEKETYTLVETKAPEGYVTAEKIRFTVKENDRIQKIVMKDDVTRVKISKKDITSQEELPGAKLQLLNQKEEVIEEWISKESPHLMEMLPVGEYILREIQAPEKYETAEEIKFSVEDTAEFQQVVMYDRKKTDTPDKTKSPKTGDHTPIMGYCMKGVLSLMILFLLKRRRAAF